MKKFTKIIIGLILLIGGIFLGKTFFNAPSEIPPPIVYSNENAGTGGIIPVSYDPVNGIIYEVKDGDKIQDAVVKAKFGDLIRVFPGTYKETVYIDKDGITFQGIIIEGEWPTLDGEKELNDAFLYSGNNITIENFKIINYKGNAIMGQAGNNFVIRNNWIIDTGVYGIFPEFGTNGLIEYNILSKIEDAAIYVGMCDNIDVKFNEVFDNVAGIEIENTRHALVEGNYVHDNTGGILVFITPGLPIKTTYDVIVRDNFVVDNNTPNFAIPGSMVSSIPRGTGIIIMAGDDVIVENNIISGNINIGIVITDLSFGAQMSNDPDVEPYPDRVTILDNFMHSNGSDPVEEVKLLMKAVMLDRGPDVAAIGGGVGSTIRNRSKYVTFGLGSYGEPAITSTKSIKTFLLDEMVKPRVITPEERAKLTYYGICAGCHAYDIRMIGPPTKTIQALYNNNPQGIADYAGNPVRKREDFPEMPPQSHIDAETRLEVAKFMLALKK
jgi:parallel beta-helix repeat protein